MVVPEINPEHLEIIPAQRKRLGTKRGFIAVKSNCSLQSYVPALHPLRQKYGIDKALVCTYQAISGAGKTFETWPEMIDNVIPYIGGEEEKSEQEPMKLWGKVVGDHIENTNTPSITAQCLRVPVSNGHMAAVFMSFPEGKKPSVDEIKDIWANYKGRAQELDLPSAPKQFLHYFEEDNRPQTKLDRKMCIRDSFRTKHCLLLHHGTHLLFNPILYYISTVFASQGKRRHLSVAQMPSCNHLTLCLRMGLVVDVLQLLIHQLCIDLRG